MGRGEGVTVKGTRILSFRARPRVIAGAPSPPRARPQEELLPGRASSRAMGAAGGREGQRSRGKGKEGAGAQEL